MKLLFDQNLSFKLCARLDDLFSDSTQAKLLDMEGAADRELWAYAKVHGFVIVTQDADFADMSALFGSPPKVIWLRCGNQPTTLIEQLLRSHATAIMSLEADAATDCLEIA